MAQPEFREFEKDGKLPQLSKFAWVMITPTVRVRAPPTPRALVADNDLAVGRLVEALQQQPLLERHRCLHS